MTALKRKAYAKINLGLDVLRKRKDGYHDVNMVMQTIGLHDEVTISTMEEKNIVITSNLQFLPVDAGNIAYRAASLVLDTYGHRVGYEGGIHINLDKHIPVAAGMAGGSTDAAAVISGIDQLLGIGMTIEEKTKLGVRLGADVPYCIVGGTMLSQGIGDILWPLPSMPNCFILIANPPFSVSTKQVYENLKLDENTEHADIDGVISGLEKRNLEQICGSLGNVLESVTVSMHPEIQQIKNIMNHHSAYGALMSGSGPTVFGIFPRRSLASEAEEELKKKKLIRYTAITTPCN